MDFEVIVTMGPSILDDKKLKEIDKLGPCVYRLNGAHVDHTQAPRLIDRVRDVLPNAKIMIDLPSNKVRTFNLPEPIRLAKNEVISLYDYQLNYPEFYKHLKKGDIVKANDSIFTLEVVEVIDSTIKLLSYSDGLLLTNKGIHVRGAQEGIPFLLKRDIELIEVANKCSVDYVALSFVRTVEDINEVKKVLNRENINLIAKIETLSAVNNLESILSEVGSILVDRGDLSTEIDILKLAEFQIRIINAAKNKNVKVYLATQFLKNMETKPVPLIPEIIDLCNTLSRDIKGIQLSEETAIGKYPYECVKLVFDALNVNK